MGQKTASTRLLAGASVALLALAGMVGCAGAASGTSATTTVAPTSLAATTEAATGAAVTEDSKPTYAYMGYGDIPDNADLAAIASGHYYVELTIYSQYVDQDGETYSGKYDQQYAQDYANSLSKDYDENGNLASVFASIDGTNYSADYLNGVGYTEQDESASTPEEDKADYQAVIEANDETASTLKFVGKGKAVIPLIDDDAEYTYYEYTDSWDVENENGETETLSPTHRVYVDGTKLVAMTNNFDTNINVSYYRTVATDIPEGFIAVPDMSGLEMIAQ